MCLLLQSWNKILLRIFFTHPHDTVESIILRTWGTWSKKTLRRRLGFWKKGLAIHLDVLIDVVMDPKDDEIPLNLMMLLSQTGAIITTGFLKQLDFLQTTPHADSTGKKKRPIRTFPALHLLDIQQARCLQFSDDTLRVWIHDCDWNSESGRHMSGDLIPEKTLMLMRLNMWGGSDAWTSYETKIQADCSALRCISGDGFRERIISNNQRSDDLWDRMQGFGTHPTTYNENVHQNSSCCFFLTDDDQTGWDFFAVRFLPGAGWFLWKSVWKQAISSKIACSSANGCSPFPQPECYYNTGWHEHEHEHLLLVLK